MTDSILNSIKKLIGGIDENDHAFDTDIIMFINSQFAVLYQLGVGDNGFTIEDDSTTWSDYLPNMDDVEMIKSYIAIQVKLLFDPPASAALLEAYKNKAAEYEWRINVAFDPATNNLLRSEP